MWYDIGMETSAPKLQKPTGDFYVAVHDEISSFVRKVNRNASEETVAWNKTPEEARTIADQRNIKVGALDRVGHLGVDRRA